MTDQQHAAAAPGPGPRPGSGADAGLGDAVPRDAVPTAGEEPGAPGLPHGFRRDRRHKILGGVCAGLGRQCDMDPVIFRIVLAVLAATGGLGLIFYGFAWLFVAYDDEEENEARKLLTGGVDGPALAAVLFALVGCGAFLSMLSNTSVLTFAVVLGLLLAGAGYWSQRRGTPDPDPLAAQAAESAPPEAQAPPVPASFPSWWRDPIVKDGTHTGGTGYLWGPKEARDIAAATNIAHGNYRREVPSPRREAKPRGPRRTGGWVFLLALLAGLAGTGATWDDQALGTSLQTGFTSALLVFGLGIAVSAFLGRTGAGSIILAVLTAGLLAASAALPKDIGTHWQRMKWQPTAVTDIRPKYHLGTGVGTLDLSKVTVGSGRTVTIRAEVGVGKLEVVVPKNLATEVDIEVGVGDIQLPGDTQQDVDVQPGKHKELTLAPTTGSKGRSGGTLNLSLEVGVGQAEVSRAAA